MYRDVRFFEDGPKNDWHTKGQSKRSKDNSRMDAFSILTESG
jgi:hypothetical protein